MKNVMYYYNSSRAKKSFTRMKWSINSHKARLWSAPANIGEYLIVSASLEVRDERADPGDAVVFEP